MFKFKKTFVIIAACIAAFAMVGCSSKTNGTSDQNPTTGATSSNNTATTAPTDSSLSGSISGSGSSALLPLAQNAADSFMQKNPNVSITLNAGGSGTGLKQVSDGSVDIGNSDVPAEAKLEAAQASALVDHKVCAITMATIVNNDVAATVKSLTKQQLIDIFTAKTTNWKDVGGPDEPVVLVTRPTTSGTRALYQQYALDGNEEASNASLETDDSGALLQTVSGQKGAIGYVALSYLVNNTGVSALAIDGVAPTIENTYNGTYPVWGYEHMYTKGEAAGAIKAYIDYVTSDEYSSQLEAQGYNVTAKMTTTR